ncbi:hypothetical protein WICPIJ_006252 [Wickerhamomyces pijperi]|uniref:Secreted protein n=1 Tax=Wickerhamomyces pijperi TaxID=599730 RepID=A0A9P8Q2H6_WICPI|nr:hypothetical protein WICPIJ_006252 [Wickerhamomyces pijperi]
MTSSVEDLLAACVVFFFFLGRATSSEAPVLKAADSLAKRTSLVASLATSFNSSGVKAEAPPLGKETSDESKMDFSGALVLSSLVSGDSFLLLSASLCLLLLDMAECDKCYE